MLEIEFRDEKVLGHRRLPAYLPAHRVRGDTRFDSVSHPDDEADGIGEETSSPLSIEDRLAWIIEGISLFQTRRRAASYSHHPIR